MGYFSSASCSSLDLVDLRAGARRELLGHIAALQPGDDVKAGRPDGPGHLLDADVGVAAQVGHVAVIVLVGKDQAHARDRPGCQPLPARRAGGAGTRSSASAKSLSTVS